MKRALLLTLLSGILVFGLLPGSAGRWAVEAGAPPDQPAAVWTGHPSCAGVSAEMPSTPDCDALIAARPAPNVAPIPVDFGVMAGRSFIRFKTGEVPLYDAPGGQIVDSLSVGYSYFMPLRFDGGWAEVRRGRWVSLAEARFAQPSTLSGVLIGGLDMPFAWVLWPHCPANVPGGARSCETLGKLQRYQLVNIYATVNVGGWNWHLIGPGIWTNQQNLSIVQPVAPAEFAGRWVGVNTYEQNLVAYEGGVPVMAALVSTGIENGEWDTPAGTFTVRLMMESGKMDGAAGAEDFYSLDEVPYHMYFNGLIALHGAYWHDSFGYTHSHGCVNLSVSDARWLFHNWVTEGMTVYVYGEEE